MRATFVTLGVLVALGATAPAAAELRIVATTSSMGMLAREVGGGRVSVTTLVPPDRDPHYLLARPSMMAALRRADLLVAVGADLEVGWLPAAIQGANNPRIVPGQPGYFEGATRITLIERDGSPDRARGDVHPGGNPHYYMDPERLAIVGRALATVLGTLDPPGRAEYERRATAFETAVAARVPRWRGRAADAPGVVFFHKDGNYLAALLNVPILGFVEPLPGIPPTAAHLRDLVRRLEGSRGIILYNTFHPREGPEFLSRHLGWPARQLQLEVGLDATGAAYLDHIDTWVTAIAGRSS
jgi:zinc/manganese transport system substrate-binding protein